LQTHLTNQQIAEQLLGQAKTDGADLVGPGGPSERFDQNGVRDRVFLTTEPRSICEGMAI